MMLMILALTAIAVVSLLMYFSRFKARRNLRCHRQKGISKLELLKRLLIHIQQHRGLSNGELNGGCEFKNRVASVGKEIARDWGNLELVDIKLSDNERFIGVYTHWNRLKFKYSGLSVNNNLEQHNRLILNLLYLIEDVSESHCLDYIQPDTQGIEVIWKELLETAESVGQVRALGTGIVASGGCDSIQRMQVRFLNEKIKRMLNVVTTSLQRSLDNGSSESLIAPLLEKVISTEGAINQLTELNEKELFKAQGISITSEAYFALASSCIDPLMTLFDEGIDHLKRII